VQVLRYEIKSCDHSSVAYLVTNKNIFNYDFEDYPEPETYNYNRMGGVKTGKNTIALRL
jgi:uncharacterized membrane protein (UPF0182 family)